MDFKKRKINFLEHETQDSAHLEPSQQSPKKEKYKPENFTEKAHFQSSPGKKKKPKRKKVSGFFIVLIIVFLFVSSVVSADNDSFLSGMKNSYLLRQITNIISSSDKELKGEEDDRINFVLLGMGGAGHSGPYLTDTIVIASFRPSTQEAAMFSLPRDMIVPIESGYYRKINAVYTIGEQREVGGGGPLVKEIIEKTFDIPIHYFAAVDFNGFKEMIDAIGGIEVDVERAFTDYQFPAYDEKYQTVQFETGLQEMNGETALNFARSRHGNNGEGSDFARIKRQQKIILAAKEKLTSFNTLINPKKITNLYSLFNEYTKTDVEPWEAVKLIHMGKGLDTQKIISQSIDNRPGGYLKAGISVAGAYILQPVSGSYEQISALIKNIFALAKVSDENANIVIQNGTIEPGLALKAVNHLTEVGYNVNRYGNSHDQNKISTIIYDYTGENPQTKKSLESIFQTKAETDIPIDYTSTAVAQAWDIRDEEGQLTQLDFLIVLGQDQIVDENLEIIKTIDPSLLSTSTPTSTQEDVDQEENIE